MPFSCLNSPTDYKLKSKLHSMKHGTLQNPIPILLYHIHHQTHPLDSDVLTVPIFPLSEGLFFTLLVLCKKQFPSVTFTTLSSHSSTPNSYVTSSLEDFCPLRQAVSHHLLGMLIKPVYPTVTLLIILYPNFTFACFTCSGQRPFFIYLYAYCLNQISQTKCPINIC